jgi:hypothetical protein
MKRIYIDVNEIPDELYEMLLNEFKRQGGNGSYYEWSLSAVKEVDEEDYDIV